MNQDRSPRPRILLSAAAALVITAGLIVLFFLILRMYPSPGAGTSERDTFRVDGNPSLESATAGQEAAQESLTVQSEKADGEEVASEELEETPPLLEGVVEGEPGPLADARVILFSVREIEAMLRRLERFDPGAGLPDVPELLAAVRTELDRFRDSGIQARTDEHGYYAFHGVGAAAYLVLSLGPGHVFRYGDVVSLAPGRTARLDLRLHRGAAIAGRVVDRSGGGMPGVTVTAEYRPAGMAGVGRLVQKALRYVNGEFLKGPFQSATDEEGAFAVDALPPGTYDLVAERPGFPESRLENVTTGTREAVILLTPGVALEGVLVDEFGVPVPDIALTLDPVAASVTLPFPGASELTRTARQILEEPAVLAVSDELGAFEFSSVARGSYWLDILATGFLPVRRPVEVGEDAVSVGVVRLERGESIGGRIGGQAGQPIAGASVSAFPENLSLFSVGSAVGDLVNGRGQVLSDASGHFRISGLTAGQYRVIAQATGHGARMEEHVRTGEEALEITLEPGIDIAGRIVDDVTSEPLADVRVSASGVRGRSTRDGEFLLAGVPPRDPRIQPLGDFGGRRGRRGAAAAPSGDDAASGVSGDRFIRIRAAAAGYQDERVLVVIAETGKPVEIRMRRKIRLHGLALDPQGEPVAGALLRLVPGDARAPILSEGLVFLDASVSGMDGEFALDVPFEGREVSILASHPLYATTPSDLVDPAAHDAEHPVEIRLAQGGTVRGVVTDGQQEIAGARLRLSRSRERRPGETMFIRFLGLPPGGDETFSREDGTFVYESVHPGEYELTAELAGFGDTWSESFSVAEDGVRDVRIVLDPGGAIAGVVIDQDALPLPGASVRILREDVLSDEMARAQRLLGGAFRRATTDPEGRFHVDGLPAAGYTVIAEKARYSPVEIHGVAPAGDELLEIALPRDAEITGRVVDAASALPIPAFELRLAPGDGAGGAEPAGSEGAGGRWGPLASWREVRDSDGRYLLDGLSAGWHRIDVRARGYAAVSNRILLDAGDHVELPFALVRAGRLEGRVIDAVTRRPVEGARVRLIEPSPPDDSSTPDSSRSDPAATLDPKTELESYFRSTALAGSAVSSDQQGVFLQDSFPEGARDVLVEHETHVPELRKGIEIGLGESREETILLSSGSEIVGSLLEAGGAPRANGWLLVRGLEATNRHIRKGASTGANGWFRVRGLSTGRYAIIVPGQWGAAAFWQPVEVGDPSTPQEVVIRAQASP